MRHAVCAILIRDTAESREILLGRRSPSRTSYAGCWDLPGGHVEPHESAIEALAREMMEELGVRPESPRHLATLEEPDPARLDVPRYDLYLVTRWSGQPRLRGDEHDELRWIPVEQAVLMHGLALAGYRAIFAALSRSG